MFSLVGLSEAVYKNTSVSFQEKKYILPDSAMIQFPTALPGKSYFFHILSVPTCGVYRGLNVCVIWGFFSRYFVKCDKPVHSLLTHSMVTANRDKIVKTTDQLK